LYHQLCFNGHSKLEQQSKSECSVYKFLAKKMGIHEYVASKMQTNNCSRKEKCQYLKDKVNEMEINSIEQNSS
jgi:CDP-diacylglycerol pyrophosphatase